MSNQKYTKQMEEKHNYLNTLVPDVIFIIRQIIEESTEYGKSSSLVL